MDIQSDIDFFYKSFENEEIIKNQIEIAVLKINVFLKTSSENKPITFVTVNIIIVLNLNINIIEVRRNNCSS